MAFKKETSISMPFMGVFSKIWFLRYYGTKTDISEFENKKEILKDRRIVWGFKDGLNPKLVIQNIADDLDEFVKKNFKDEDVYICIIPASSIPKTEARFKVFCKGIVSQTSLLNGYDLIKSIGSREETKGGGQKVDIIEYLEFGDVKDKNIILFDDVYTTGKSFNAVRYKLHKQGAKKVIGAFLSRTYWEENERKL